MTKAYLERSLQAVGEEQVRIDLWVIFPDSWSKLTPVLQNIASPCIDTLSPVFNHSP
jgi:hypothetical protein